MRLTKLILFCLISFISCKSIDKVKKSNFKPSLVNCSDSLLEKRAENLRRVSIKDSMIVLSDYNDMLYKDLDSLKISANIDFNSITNRLENQSTKYKYQNPGLIYYIKQAKKNVENFIQISDEKRPIISTKPGFYPYAKILMSPDKHCKRRIIFINEGVSITCYEIPRTLINLISIEQLSKSKFSYNIQDKYFIDNKSLIQSEFGNLWSKEYIPADLDQLALIWHYVSGIYHFLIAHEYAHDILNHNGEKNIVAVDNELNEDKSITEIAYNWAQELEADYHASKLMVEISKKDDLGLPLPHLFIWGGEYYFTFLDFFRFSENYVSSNEVMLKNTLTKLEQTNPNKEEIINDFIFSLRSFVNKEVPNLYYKNLDSLSIKINESLPNNPNTKDFQNLLIKFNLIDNTSTHPPSFIRRVICRISVNRNSTLSGLVSNQQNHGDLFWENFSKSYSILKETYDNINVQEMSKVLSNFK